MALIRADDARDAPDVEMPLIADTCCADEARDRLAAEYGADTIAIRRRAAGLVLPRRSWPPESRPAGAPPAPTPEHLIHA